MKQSIDDSVAEVQRLSRLKNVWSRRSFFDYFWTLFSTAGGVAVIGSVIAAEPTNERYLVALQLILGGMSLGNGIYRAVTGAMSSHRAEELADRINEIEQLPEYQRALEEQTQNETVAYE